MRGLWSVAVLVCLGLVCAAQNSERQPKGQPPTLRVEAQAVVLDVVVTNRSGDPVPGLHMEDFHVTENGVPQKIAYFEEHAPVQPVLRKSAPLPPGVFTNLPSAPRGDSMNVVLLDAVNTSPQDQLWVMREVREFLQSSRLDTPVAIFSLTSHLRLVHDFTTDAAALLASVSDKNAGLWPEQTALSRQSKNDVSDLDNLSLLETMHAEGMEIGSVAAVQQEHSAMQMDQQLRLTLLGLQALARVLAAYPGRKNLMWFADRFPIAFTADRGGATPVGVVLQQNEQTSGLLAGARISVYPIAATGVDANTWTDASSWNAGNAQTASAMRDQARLASAAVMDEMAQQTGGEAIRNRNDLATALGHAIQNGEHYYTLSYSPTDSNLDGRLRRIAVNASDAKLQLSYRRSYYAVDWSAAPPMNPLRPLLLKSVPDARQLLFVARVSPEAQDPAHPVHEGNAQLRGALRRFKVDVLIPAGNLRLEQTGGKYHGRLEIDVVAWGADGRAVNWAGGPVQVNLDTQAYATEQRVGLPWHLSIDVPDNADALKVGVYDWNTGRAGTMQIPLADVHAVSAQR